MLLMLTAFGVISIFELTGYFTLLWRWRRLCACVIIFALSIVSGLLVGRYPTVWSVLVLFFSAFRVVNLLRVVKNRINIEQLKLVSMRASVTLIACQLCVLFFAFANTHVSILLPSLWLVLLLLQVVVAAVILFTVNHHMRTTNPPSHIQPFADAELPTLTVAIPARNETEDLKLCLSSLIDSTYPKLEILVLDDCSQLKRTPEIIRKFAHDGVRFVAGKIPPDRWLAKNYAYEQLVQESNGDIILFCGVDVRFSQDSLRLIIDTMIMKHKTMMSIMPKNDIPNSLSLFGKLIQPSRYSWELALPRRRLHRPPVLSTCWLISRDTLKKFGGFDAVSHSISPESFFAKKSITGDSYSFLKNNEVFGIDCDKNVSEQFLTAVRTRYPQLHKRIELVGVVTLIELFFVFAPYFFFFIGIIERDTSTIIASGVASILLGTFYIRMVDATYQTRIWYGFALLPFATLLDIGILNYSMWQYEFNEVIWKNRNVCIPIMQTFDSLPKLP